MAAEPCGNRRAAGWWAKMLVLMLAVAAAQATARAQAASSAPADSHRAGRGQAAAQPAESTARPTDSVAALLRHLPGDQRALWTAPVHVRTADALWLVPLGGLTAALVATDSATSRHLGISRQSADRSRLASDAAVGALIGGAGAAYLWGRLTHNDHQKETGLLAIEALANALALNNVVNLAAGRERPNVDNARGRWWVGGRSFPSNHATAAWAVAGVIAHEYPGWLPRLVAYGAASVASTARVAAREHFPADVLVGGAIGYLVAQQIYRAHHDPLVGGSPWNSFQELAEGAERNPANFASPEVPLDSWVYPAFERLAALGYVDSAMLGERPWTRRECLRLLEEVEDRLRSRSEEPPRTVEQLYDALRREFAPEAQARDGAGNRAARVESVYLRVTGISGPALSDGYHFGQTVTNDFGRPYAEGASVIAGGSGWATVGPVGGYVRGEFQHAPSAPPLPDAVRQVISRVDGLPPMPALGEPAVDRFDLLEGYAAFAWRNWQITAGKQSLWWGPGAGGAMIWSDNAEPVFMVRLNRTVPFALPGPFARMGPIRAEFFVGRLDGHQFTYSVNTGLIGQWGQPLADQPMIEGAAFTFRPTANLELGFSATSIFAGAGVPFTTATLVRAIVSGSNGPPGCFTHNVRCPVLDPGDRRTGFHLVYRLPGLRNWATFYADSFADDEISPIAYFDRSANSAGLFLPRLPGLDRVTLRLEGVYSDNPISSHTSGNLCCGFYYSNGRYRNGYTNDGRLIGSWIGRDGQGLAAWLTYWASAQSFVQAYWRHQKVSHQFLPGGGTLWDAGLRSTLWLSGTLAASASVQYEQWTFPVLAPRAQTVWTASVGLSYWPHRVLRW